MLHLYSSLTRGIWDYRDRPSLGGNSEGTGSSKSEMGREREASGTGKGLVCFHCQQSGHKASVYPMRKSKLNGYCYVPKEGDGQKNVSDAAVYYNIKINVQELQAPLDIL